MEGIFVIIIMVIIGYVIKEFSRESNFYRDVDKMIDHNVKEGKRLTQEFLDSYEKKDKK